MLVDVVIIEEFFEIVIIKIVGIDFIFFNWEGVDIGFKICEIYVDVIKNFKFVVWNGLMGVFEMILFVEGIKVVG